MVSKNKTPMTKTIGGKRYGLGRIRAKKSSAENVAESYRKDGYSARISEKYSNGYGIYVRKRK